MLAKNFISYSPNISRDENSAMRGDCLGEESTKRSIPALHLHDPIAASCAHDVTQRKLKQIKHMFRYHEDFAFSLHAAK